MALSPEALNLDLKLPGSHRKEWAGAWSVRFIDPTGSHPDASADAQIYVYGGLQPKLISPAEFVLGSSASVVAAILDETGAPATEDGLFVVRHDEGGRDRSFNRCDNPAHLHWPRRIRPVHGVVRTPSL